MSILQLKNNVILLLIMTCLAYIPTEFVFCQSESLIEKETVYVPAYSSIFYGNLIQEYSLAVTLSIHNINTKYQIVIDTIDYYDKSGKLIQSYIKDKKITLQPFETYLLGIKETDYRAGVGANFIVKWHALTRVNKPIIETIMIGRKERLGISFISRGVSIIE